MSVLNQYSYIIISLIALGASLVVMRYFLVSRRAISTTLIGLSVLMLMGFLLLRPGMSDVNSVETAEDIIRNGNPTLLEFFSNYCAGCLAIRPVVDAISDEISGEFNILRVDIHSPTGRELRELYNFSFTPEFILFNRGGQEIWRSHTPPTSNDLALASGSGGISGVSMESN